MFENRGNGRAGLGEALVREIPAGETILWSGAPGTGVRFQAWDLFVVPFSFVWLGGILAVFIGGDTASKANAPSLLFLLPFLLVGGYFAVGRFLVDIWRRSVTAYALTRREAIVVVGGPWRRVSHVRLSILAECSLSGEWGGRGTIWLGAQGGIFDYRNQGLIWGFGASTPCFECIDDARTVYGQVLAIRAGSVAPRAGA